MSFTLLGAVEQDFQGMIYVSKNTLTLKWDVPTGVVTKYKIQAVDVLHDPQTRKDIGETTESQVVLYRLTSSLWEYQVCACNDAGCSDWAKSSDETYATVNGQPESWWVYWKLPTPTGGGVN